MYLITYKKGLNSEKSKFEFDRPLTFIKANEMLIDAVVKFKQTGQNMKISYKIIEISTGEGIFNSKISIDRDIPSLYQLIKENSNAPKTVIDYIKKVENRDVIETEDFNSINHIEETARLEQLKAEKNDIYQQLKKDEKERLQRDIDYQKKMKDIENEKNALVKALQLKEKEEKAKELERLKALEKLEEEKRRAMQLMEEKRDLDKKKKEEHEKRLKEVEEESQKAEIELASIQTELEKKELERKKELRDLELKKLEVDRKANVLKAESDKEEIKHQQEIISFNKLDNASKQINGNHQTTMLVSKLTLREKLQGIDFEEVKGRSIQFVKFSLKGSVKGSKKAYRFLKKYNQKRATEKQEKLKNLSRQVDIEEKIALEKMKFMEELKQDRLKQEKEIRREARKKEKETKLQSKVEERYRAAKVKKLGRIPIYKSSSFKFIYGLVGIIIVVLGSIYLFDVGDTYPVLKKVENHLDAFISMISNVIRKS
ncbi:hypothetical protein B4102_2191 [Heyndrickxia sporothermodurans]|uniref:Uncharacterized protein n=1 Tax=Heyndrickxia sporothermodurans TaxID=46224 RepID=A0A150LGF8_9BACI|nr:hypothetical protein [Heyndrickxia sporothermodurans]KYD11463.1 hypothetical protein B4102_2191 [Heyndrickxia sporothermodurans]